MQEQTLAEVFLRNIRGPLRDRTAYHSRVAIGKPFATITFSEFGARVLHAAGAFKDLGIQKGDRVAVVSESRLEWVITDYACILIGAITVPMFPTLTYQQVEHILVDCGARCAVVSNEFQFGKILKSLERAKSLESVIVCNRERPRSEIPARIRVMDWQAFEEGGSIFNADDAVTYLDVEDVVTIIYTSGTTGVPRGVMLTHHNLLSNIEGACAAIPPVTDKDIFLSFLPLSHSFERIASYLTFVCGASVAYSTSIDAVAEDMLDVRPTIMTAVPRFFERVLRRVMQSREKLLPVRQRLFDWAFRVGSIYGQRFEGKSVPLAVMLEHPIADKLVLSKIRARTGGRIRFMISGAAALSADVGRAFAAFGIRVYEGYGMTEASPVISVTSPTKVKWGSVGLPLRNMELKIAEDGEILARGPSVMKGYYNMPEETASMIDSQGWLHTGDVGELDADGVLRITDRKKHLFVSSGGKNIAPASIESKLLESDLIDQVMLIGDKRPYVAALIVPDFELMERAVGKRDAHGAQEALRELVQREIDARLQGVANYERVRRFAVLTEPFTIENAMLTPTLKVKRKEVESRYAELIESLYKDSRDA